MPGKQPFQFQGTIGTTAFKLASWTFDSMFIANDAAAQVYYSVAGQAGPFQRVGPGELVTLDRFVDGGELWVYASAAATAVRCTLWDTRA